MNILFYVPSTPNPLNGGTERVSYILANEFIKHNHTCYCIYFKEVDPNYTTDVYKNTFYVPFKQEDIIKESLSIIKNYHIDIVINQMGGFWIVGEALGLLRKTLDFKLFTTIHNNPIENSHVLKERYSHFHSFKELIYFIIYKTCPPLFNRRISSMRRRQFRKEIAGSNKYIFLSQAYKRNVINQYQIQDSPDIVSLPNPLTYDSFFEISNYQEKKKQVLIVARFNETHKRLSKALKIWKSIEGHGYNGWKLIIIGHGEDEKLYKDMIKNMDIKDIEIKGKSYPEPYYRESSIFLMTSTFEGWPMTIQEAMQLGCVPLAFDTFEAVREMIQDGENGFVIKDNNDTTYSKKLIELMDNTELRMRMAEKAIESRKQYSADKIIKYWLNMMTD